MSLSARRSDLIVYLSPAHTATHVHTQTHSPTCLSFHCEATGLLDRSQQLVVQLVVALVGRNVNPIEAGEKIKSSHEQSCERLKGTDFCLCDRISACCVRVCRGTWHTPGMGFGQIVGVSIDLMNGEESGSRSACRPNTNRMHQEQSSIRFHC